jgi:hypothetical protein
MHNDIDTKAIAARIRGLIGGQDRGVIEATARRLDVSEVALRITIDEHEPHPTVEVLAAIVRHYGVDPSWIVSGEYDAAAHRAALGEEAEVTRAELARIVAARLSPSGSNDSPARGNLRLEA